MKTQVTDREAHEIEFFLCARVPNAELGKSNVLRFAEDGRFVRVELKVKKDRRLYVAVLGEEVAGERPVIDVVSIQAFHAIRQCGINHQIGMTKMVAAGN